MKAGKIMKRENTIIIITITIILGIVSCETSDDITDGLDITSPRVTILTDSVTVSRGDLVNLKASVEDETGLLSYSIDYAQWSIPGIIQTIRTPGKTLNIDTLISVPANALCVWEGEYRLNSGTTYNSIEQYHAIALNIKDISLNEKKVYFYVRVLGDTVAPVISEMSYKVFDNDKEDSNGIGSFTAKPGQNIELTIHAEDESLLKRQLFNSQLKQDTTDLLNRSNNEFVSENDYTVKFSIPDDIPPASTIALEFMISDYFNNQSGATYILTISN